MFLHDAVELGGFIWHTEVSLYTIISCVYRLGPCSPRNLQGVPVESQKFVNVPFCGNMLGYLGVTMPIMNYFPAKGAKHALTLSLHRRWCSKDGRRLHAGQHLECSS